MDNPAISSSERARLQERQMSLWYAMLLTGVVGASYIPLAYWGVDGLLLCVWLVLVGLALLHEQLLIAGLLICCGILGSLGADMPLSSIQRQTAADAPQPGVAVSDLVIPLAVVLGCGILVAAITVWVCNSMQRDVAWLAKAFGFDAAAPDLERDQYSISNMFGLLTLLCVALLPMCYGGLSSGLAFSPIVLAAGVLILYRNFRLALAIVLAAAAVTLVL